MTPKGKPNDFIIHVYLHDQDAKLQQETVGIIGANLLHACFNETDPKEILKKLYNNTNRDSVEINMVEVDDKQDHDSSEVEVTKKRV